ncbi:MAG: holo-ACP synthase [Planctomycetota bacterium]
MAIVGHGIDLVETRRIERLIERHGPRFLERVYTLDERSYCERDGKRRIEKLAARFAAKEAVLKAMGTGLTQGIAWTEVEVTRDPLGRPGVRLSGTAAAEASARGIGGWWLSLSHIEGHAVASAVAEGG